MTPFPLEFANPPRLLPPNMEQPGTEELWLVMDEWRSPVLTGNVQVVIRGAIQVPGAWFGFWSDGLSAPEFTWTATRLHPWKMPEALPALIHDAEWAAELRSKDQSDEDLFDLECRVVSQSRAWMIYEAPHRFGQEVWDAHTPQSIADARQVVQLVKAGDPAVWAPPQLPEAKG